VTLKVTWRQALAWRMRQQWVAPVGDAAVEDVVRRLVGVQAQVASSAELAVRLRRRESEPGDVAAALADGRLIKTWAMRGTIHLLTPEEGGAALSLLAAGKSWHRPSWQRYFHMTIGQMEELRFAIRDALDGQVLTREELIAEITRRPSHEHLGDALKSGWGTLLKPSAWQGELVFGPNRGTRVTFTAPHSASSRWAGVPEPDEAGPALVRRYLAAYGPATTVNFAAWLSRSGRNAKRWFGPENDVQALEVDGQVAYIRAEDADALAAARPSKSVRLLGGFDQWVLGPGTQDASVLAAHRRTAVSKTAGWIAPIVVAGGVVCGTWELDRKAVRVAWFEEAGPPPKAALEDEVGRLSSVLGRPLELAIGSV
jgi:winged helix DNA-binding protein